MPREDRRIYFDYDEAYKAIYALSVQKGVRRPPQGAITAIEQAPDDRTKVIVKIEDKLNHTQDRMDYSMDFMAAALMIYCRGLSIPLPKGGQKSVEITPPNIVLRVQI